MHCQRQGFHQPARVVFRLACVLAVLLASGAEAWAQLGKGEPAVPPAQAEPAKDPLGRSTPRGTVLGFMKAARDGDNEVAAGYLNTTLKGEAAVELARELFLVLDSQLPARLNELSDLPEGALANPLKPDQDLVGTIMTADGPLDLYVERVTRGKSPPLWLFSRATLRAIPDVFEAVDVVTVDDYFPDFLTKPRVLGIRVGTWLVLLVFVPLAYYLLGVLSALIVRLARRRSAALAVVVHDRLPGSVRILILAFAIRQLVATISLPLFERQFWAVTTAVVMIVGTVGMALLAIGFGERQIQRRFLATGLGERIALLRLGRRAVEVIVLAAGGLVALRYFGRDPTAALAGLGIGGIAVALAAQKTLENVIGGLSLVFDEAVRVGDTLKIGETVGVVDQIGLRSTRIRTLDRTIITVPNGQIAATSIETVSLRDKFLFRHVVGLRYETTPAQVRAIVDQSRELMVGRAGVEGETVRVRFLRLGASSLDVELFAYVFATDWAHFLEIQQELLLNVMELVEAAGSGIAFPSQTLYVNDARAPAPAERPEPTPGEVFNNR